jgi:hypothetical protein
MNQISLREFQLHASKYMDKLPLVLTQYNLPIAIVSKINEETTYYKKGTWIAGVDSQKAVNIPVLKNPSFSIDTKKIAHCDIPLCKSFEGHLIEGLAYTDEGEVKKKIYLCKFHIAKAKRNNEEIKEL